MGAGAWWTYAYIHIARCAGLERKRLVHPGSLPANLRRVLLANCLPRVPQLDTLLKADFSRRADEVRVRRHHGIGTQIVKSRSEVFASLFQFFVCRRLIDALLDLVKGLFGATTLCTL
jgi:hypothetical protein